MVFTLTDLQYDLPDGLIAQDPLPRRDASRLLVLDRSNGRLDDSGIAELPTLLRRGDLLVLNDTKVLPAKFTARRRTGGKVRGLFEREEHPGQWQVLLEGSRRLQVGETLTVNADTSDSVSLCLIEAGEAGRWRVSVEPNGAVDEILERIGRTPLPPYIRRDDPLAPHQTSDLEDRSRYQTVYARHTGAIAAPTAGLHLTRELLKRIHAGGVETTFVTLHVGVGTFAPVRVADLSEHVMHAEWYELNREVVDSVERCRKRGGRVVAVGTTVVRALESAALDDLVEARTVRACSDMTNIFIYPPYRFRVVDALMTNFHLPQSTLLALVMALAGTEPVRRAYQHAIQQQYRFYSYGDAMLIL